MKHLFSAAFGHRSAQTRVPESKSGGAPLVALQLTQSAHWTPRNYAALSREGYQKNPIAYRCVRLISEAAASVAITEQGSGQSLPGLFRGCSADLLERFYGYLQLSGNAYLKLAVIDGRPAGLFVLRPDQVSIKKTAAGQIAAYVYESAAGSTAYPVDHLSGRSVIFHMRLFNPIDETYGSSPLEAAAQAVDIHNKGSLWTKSLLDNSARPSGALIYGGPGGGHMSEDQFARLKDELEDAYSGAAQAGRPMVLEGGLDWKTMSLTPADMDFMQARRESAREIALAFGVPPMLLGIPGDNTYANYREANQAFWRQTVIPLVQKTARGLQTWLTPFMDEDFQLCADLDRVPALSEERKALWSRLENASFLSDREKRVMAGLSTEADHD